MATSFATPQRRALPGLRSRRLLALLDDDRLAREVAKGNEAAFEVVYDRHHRGLLAFCRHLLGSREDAEDALQQTFASAFDHLARTGAQVRLKPWLYTIARNRCISIIRARGPEPLEQVEPSTDGLQQEVRGRADLRQLLADLELLPLDQRAALILSELKGLSHHDIASILNVNTSKVKALVFQARSHLLEYRRARLTPCRDVRREIAARKRGAPTRTVRRHIAVCSECAAFSHGVREQRRALALLLPVAVAPGLKSHALAAAGITGSGSAGSGVATGTWIASHAQAVKLAALGAAAMTAVAGSLPLVIDGGEPAHAGGGAAAAQSPALWPVSSGGHAFPARSGAGQAHEAATAAHQNVAERHASQAHGRRHGAHAKNAKHRAKHRHAAAAQEIAPAQAQGQGHAYGHLHAPGWIRNHGGIAESGPPPWRPHGPRR
jgi:RNA polymerase sigma factor (sigma-70 family)